VKISPRCGHPWLAAAGACCEMVLYELDILAHSREAHEFIAHLGVFVNEGPHLAARVVPEGSPGWILMADLT